MEAPLQFHTETSSVGSIGRIEFNCPADKVNTLSSSVMRDLESIIDSISTQNELKALLITSKKPSIFLAGADLKEFPEALRDPPLLEELITRGHRTFSKLQNLPFPSIAVIDGVCFGGGLELALSCTYRIATDNPKTSFSLPETTIGVFPAWGGTQRLPPLVGLASAMDMILTGKKIDAKKAWKMHLVDALIATPFLEENVQEFLFSIFNHAEKKRILARRSLWNLKNALLEKNPIGRKILFHQARKALLAKTKGHYPAPEAALKLLEETYGLPLAKGLELEMQTAFNSSESGFSQAINLIDIFFTQETLKKDLQGVPNEAQPTPIHATGVIGAGTMGSGIAWLLTNNHYDARLKDLNWKLLGRGNGHVYSLFNKLLQHKKVTRDQLQLKFHHLSCSTDYSGFNKIDIVFEAASENLKLKQDLFKELETKLPANAIIATNTSSLTIAELSQYLEHPERFIGMHFFNPVNKMPLVEIVAGEKTSPSTTATAIDLCKKLGKTPLVVGDCAGFLVNRILACGLNEAVWMLQEGVPMKDIEKAFDDFGMPMSPFKLSDEIGNDVCYKASKSFEKAYGDRFPCPDMLRLMNDQELFGKKNDKGFYIYSSKKPRVNPDISIIISAFTSKNPQFTQEQIQDRFILAMINEANHCLNEKVVSSPAYLDLALILGAGFPPFRGGLMKYAEATGKDEVEAKLKHLEDIYGERFSNRKSGMNSGISIRKRNEF